MNPFERFGIKEVADVQFIALESDSRLSINAGDTVLYLDTLKISTIETTAEQTEARGGKGNPSLIIWDYGKEITITLQDALISAEALAVMTSGKKKIAATGAGNTITVYKTKYLDTADKITTWLTTAPSAYTYIKGDGSRGAKTSSGGNAVTTAAAPARVFYTEEADGTSNKAAYEITINAANFPGTYKVVGDTIVRNTNGKDTPFQFVIAKAKMASEVTFTMEAEGDPSVFDMNLRVLRDDNGDMVKLIRYEIAST